MPAALSSSPSGCTALARSLIRAPECWPVSCGSLLRIGLGPATDEHLESGSLRLASATFRDGDWVVRAWYVSDGASFAQVTHTVRAEHPFASELAECEQMVRTITFPTVETAA